jgi:RHS repeat-associated protein
LQIYATCPSQAACPNQPSAYIINLSFNFNLGNGTTGSDNGNVIGITNNRVGARSENFAYDSLNRITAGYSTGTNWGESYTIDAWGNLTNIGTYTGKNPLGNLACAGGNTKNQLNTCFGYDAAGNMTSNGSTVYTYDAENRLTATGGMLYIYDGDGQRVAKCAVSNCAVGTSGTFYWRSVAGETLVESDVAGSFQNEYVFFNGQRIARRSLTGTEPVYYYFSDHLGSHSIVTDTNGVIQDESDFSPYGEETVVSESIAQNYKYTGKERDSESGLDNFGARYDASSLGRFMTVDKVIITPARLYDPQRLNLYGYGRNNPLSYIDVNGEDIDLVNDTEAGRDAALQKLTKGMTSAEAANIGARQDKNGNWETFVKDKGAVSMKDASVAYKGVVGVINDHSVTVNVGLVGGGLTATFPGMGRISSTGQYAETFGAPGDRNVNVMVTPGNSPTGIEESTPYGLIKVPSPDFVAMYHEAVGETLKYRAGHESLQSNPTLDSRTVIKIENEFRQSLGMYPRTGSDHGAQVITVDGGSSK